tara:strand:+ start:416 stop:580 length:165 start_codon:yes stop_codon:yes gene_type:complete
MSEKDDVLHLRQQLDRQGREVQQEKRPGKRAEAIERLAQTGREYNSLNVEVTEQ